MRTFILSFLMMSCPAMSLTLNEAVQSAEQNAHDLKILRLKAEAAGWGQTKAFAGFLPKIDLAGRHLFHEHWEELAVPFDGSLFVMPAIQPYTSLGVNASFDIFNGFEDLSGLQASRLASEAALHDLERAEAEKQAQVRTLFYRALGSQILVDVAEQNIRTLEGHLNDVRSRVRTGVSTKYDSLRVEVQLEEAQTEKAQADDRVAVDRQKLFEEIARIDDGKPLVGRLPEDFSEIDLGKVDAKQAGTRPDRLALLNRSEESKRLARGAEAHWMPKISLFGNYEWYNNYNHAIEQSDEIYKSSYALGVSFTWNLFDGGASFAAEQQAALNARIAAEKVAQFDEAVPTAVETAKRRFGYDVMNFKAKLSSIKKAQEAVRLAEGGAKAGTRTNTEVLDAVVDLNRAKAAAVKSQIDAIEALGELELALGHPLTMTK